MLYHVKKKGGAWTVGTDDAYLSFETYAEAIETALAAAEALKRNSQALKPRNSVSTNYSDSAYSLAPSGQSEVGCGRRSP
jgi:hypothetical protein